MRMDCVVESSLPAVKRENGGTVHMNPGIGRDVAKMCTLFYEKGQKTITSIVRPQAILF
jgi:hypothetical protein